MSGPRLQIGRFKVTTVEANRIHSVVPKASSMSAGYKVGEVMWKPEYVKRGYYGGNPWPTSYEKLLALSLAEEQELDRVFFPFPANSTVMRCGCGWWAENKKLCYDCRALHRFATVLETQGVGREKTRIRRKVSQEELELQTQRSEQLSVMYAELTDGLMKHGAERGMTDKSLTTRSKLYTCLQHPANLCVMILPHVPECGVCRESMIEASKILEDDDIQKDREDFQKAMK